MTRFMVLTLDITWNNMSLCKEKIEKGAIRAFFSKRRAGIHKWMKRQMNKYIRRQSKDISEDSLEPKKRNCGWEF